jgi:transposase
VPASRGKNVSVLAAINKNGVVALQIVDGGFNAVLLTDFLREKLLPQLEQTMVVIMDNARFHHSQVVKDALNQAGVQTHYLPPYSPQLDPIEEVFSMVKSRYRASKPLPKTRPELKVRVADILEECRGYDMSYFYRHAKSFLDTALENQPFP